MFPVSPDSGIATGYWWKSSPPAENRNGVCCATGPASGLVISSVAGRSNWRPCGSICTPATSPPDSGRPVTVATGVRVMSSGPSSASFGMVSVYVVPSSAVAVMTLSIRWYAGSGAMVRALCSVESTARGFGAIGKVGVEGVAGAAPARSR